MGAGIPPPKRVYAHGWWTNEGQKISKSLGNVIDPFEIIERYGLDPVRYFLMREVPFGNDGDYSHRAIVNRINGDLANDLGNLVQRVVAMIQRYYAGAMPAPGPWTEADHVLLDAASAALAATRERLGNQAFHEALEVLWAVIRQANVYVDHQGPWALIKQDRERAGTVLCALAETVRRIAIVLQAYMPDAAGRILDQLGVAADARTFEHLGEGTAVPAETTLPQPSPVFPRFVDEDSETVPV